MHKPSAYNILVSFTAALGSLTCGYALAILGNTLEKAAFYEYMNLDPKGPGAAHTTSIIAWWNTILYVGGFFACMSYTAFGNRYGRKSGIALGATVSIIGAALQAGSINPAMMIVARLIVGAGMGVLLPAVPLYQAETAPPSNRGLLVGIHASLLGYGSMISGWIGVGFFYTGGNVGWRVPLALQTIFPLVLLIVVWFLPESPRWLYMHDRAEEAKKVLIALHKKAGDQSHLFAQKELFVIKNQIDYENQNRLPVWQALKKRSLQKRFLIGFLSLSCTQCSGLIVALTYQSIIYQSLGYSAFVAGIFGSIWSLLNGTGNFCGGMLGDYVGRKRLVAVSLVILDCMLIVLCITTDLYSGTDNKAGNNAAAVFTFLMIIVFATGVDGASLVYSSELYPGEYRAIGLSVSLSAVLIWGCVFTGAAGPAFANIGALYYVVFIVLTFVMALVVIFFFPDTKGFTLEQMSAVFGDNVVDMYGNIENAKDFINEDHNIEHADLNKNTPPQTVHIEVEGESKTETV